jgi:hypothetical protein
MDTTHLTLFMHRNYLHALSNTEEVAYISYDFPNCALPRAQVTLSNRVRGSDGSWMGLGMKPQRRERSLVFHFAQRDTEESKHLQHTLVTLPFFCQGHPRPL